MRAPSLQLVVSGAVRLFSFTADFVSNYRDALLYLFSVLSVSYLQISDCKFAENIYSGRKCF